MLSRFGDKIMNMARQHKFPDSKDRSQNHPAVLCPAERVLALFNQDHSGDPATRIYKKVRTWFEAEAKTGGWADVRWFRDVSNNYGAGCVMSTSTFAFGLASSDEEDTDDPEPAA
jgi:hypothetical protein